MNTDTIQMSLFDYFMEDEQFTIPEATALVKEQKKLQVNDELFVLGFMKDLN